VLMMTASGAGLLLLLNRMLLGQSWGRLCGRSEFAIANWKIAPGFPVTQYAEVIIEMGDAVAAHIRAYFDAETKLAVIITAGYVSDQTYEQINQRIGRVIAC